MMTSPHARTPRGASTPIDDIADMTPLRGTYPCLLIDGIGRRAAARMVEKELAIKAREGRARIRPMMQDREILGMLASRYGAAAGASRDVTTTHHVRNSTRKEH